MPKYYFSEIIHFQSHSESPDANQRIKKTTYEVFKACTYNLFYESETCSSNSHWKLNLNSKVILHLADFIKIQFRIMKTAISKQG